jgi:hypothetical protein
MNCNDYLQQDNQQDSASKQKLNETLGIVQGTLTAPFADREIAISMGGEAVATMALKRVAEQGAKSVSKMVLKKLVSIFGGATDIGDYLDVMDVLIGDKYTMIVDQETFQMIFNGAKDAYKEAFSQEFKNCLRQKFQKDYPTLTETQLTNLVNQVTSMTVISESIPTKQNVFTYSQDCFPTQVINNQTYFSKNIGPTCPMLYKQYFNEYMNSRK